MFAEKQKLVSDLDAYGPAAGKSENNQHNIHFKKSFKHTRSLQYKMDSFFFVVIHIKWVGWWDLNNNQTRVVQPVRRSFQNGAKHL